MQIAATIVEYFSRLCAFCLINRD
ncbi:MAG: hypothetical protein QG638_1096, partial [Pseudomonadota bacterium]|nr:hypothetical protein [Pseudomonadota bacterium]